MYVAKMAGREVVPDIASVSGTLRRIRALFERCSSQLGDCTIFGREIPPGGSRPLLPFRSDKKPTVAHTLPTTNPKKPTTPTSILFLISGYPDIRRLYCLPSNRSMGDFKFPDIRISG